MASTLLLEEQRREVLAVAQATLRAGLVRGTAGNVSARDPATGLVAITPTGIPYDALQPEDVVVVDLEGRAVDGKPLPSSELPMHLRVYRERRWVGGIVHTHSGYATVLAVLGREIPAVHYVIAHVGPRVPLAPYATYGSEELARLASETLGEEYRAVLLQNHGVLAVGRTLAEAYTNADTVEFLAELYCRALAVGEPIVLPADEIERVRQKFATYGQPRR